MKRVLGWMSGVIFLFASPLFGVEEALQPFLKEGAIAFESGNLQIARDRFQKALEIDPKNVIALSNLGSIELRTQKLPEAIQYFKRASRLAPETPGIWLSLGIAAYFQGDEDLALAALAQAVYLQPSNPQGHTYLGITLGKKGWLDGAEAELQKALALDDTLKDAHFNLAVIYLQRTPPSLELANRHYRRARELGAEADSVIEKQLAASKEKGTSPAAEN